MNSIKNKMLSMVNIKDIETVVKAKMLLRKDAQINVEQYLEEWATNKSHIFKLFGEKLTLEEEVELDLTQNLKVIDLAKRSFISECVINCEENLFKLMIFFEKLSPVEFANNIINLDREILGIKISKGNKISRTISKFVSDKKIASDITTKYSMVVQEFKAKGKVVLSIDPMDYFTMSENDSNWTSCHSLTGCYQTGTVAYLQDSTTVIAYAKPIRNTTVNFTMSENDSNWTSCHSLTGCYQTGTVAYLQDSTTVIAYAKPIRNTTVNFYGEVASYSNKIWRQVVMFSDNFVYATQSRQYPADMVANRATVGNMLIKLLEGYNNTKYVSQDWDVSDNWAAIECHECANADMVANRATVGNMLIKLLEGYNNTKYVSQDWDVSDNWAAIECHECANNDVDWYCYNDITHEAFETAYSIIPSSFENADEFFKEMRENGEYCSPSSSVACLYCGQYHLDNAGSLICCDC